eukprot:NODE_6_length_3630_cov_83.016755_g5_i0.p1 GENE.NODE_6_length_3630_cov_83.016755_g5_i0~~NODE_6_length_3630_cov_83.016755_g5_i0.p1  ORF type:complete len:845 (-),score=10.28 NODE_6_length_3630_cov_83.016755_g5_i0:292-2826(-)
MHIGIQSKEDPTMHYESFEDASLKEFFARPVLIDTSVWTVGTTYNNDFNPWLSYFSTPSVKRKLDNFYMMRANLHVKIMINGTPFHYGRIIASYQPLHLFNSKHSPAQFSDPAMFLMKMSCLPHAFIDPTTSTPIQFDLPFVYPLNYAKVIDMIEANLDSANLGLLHFKSFLPLAAVSDTAASVLDISVYAWASDVELVIPTNSIVSASKKNKKVNTSSARGAGGALKNGYARLKQSVVPNDESSDGLISSVSSIVANAAGALSGVPFIGDVAGTVGAIASGVGSVARFFGFSRPPVFTDAIYTKSTPISSLALTQGNETVSKLTFDPKQGVTMDPAVSAMGEQDELAMSMFTNKETFISTVLWASTDVRDTVLFWSNVTPVMSRFVSPTWGTEHMFTSLGFASLPFKYWSGSIIFRFQFVSSAYHTGRVRVTFEPNGAPFAGDNSNTTYSQIIDLAQGTDVSFVVPWAQPQPYRETPNELYNEFFIPPSGLYNYSDVHCNGIIYLTVLNSVVSPDALKDVSINVYVRGGEDFELAVPAENDFMEKGIYMELVDPVVAASTIGNSAIEPEKLSMLFGDVQDATQINNKQSVFFGESITSFRPLLKRYQYAGTRCHTKTAETNIHNFFRIWGYAFPPTYGLTPPDMAYSQMATLDAFNFNPTSLLCYLNEGFLGYRGAIRWKFLPSGISSSFGRVKAKRRNLPPILGSQNMVDWGDVYAYASTTITPLYLGAYLTTNGGSIWPGAYAAPMADGQPAVEIEIPWYSPERFSSCEGAGQGPRSYLQPDHGLALGWQVEFDVKPDNGGANTIYDELECYVATGEDFQFNFYLGPVRKGYYYPSYQPTF